LQIFTNGHSRKSIEKAAFETAIRQLFNCCVLLRMKYIFYLNSEFPKPDIEEIFAAAKNLRQKIIVSLNNK
jgi:hypothetical protein